MFSSESGISELDSDDFYGPGHRSTVDPVKMVLKYMEEKGLSLAQLFESIFYGDPDCTNDYACRRHRTTFFQELSLPQLLVRIMKNSGPNGPKVKLVEWMTEYLMNILDEEIARAVSHLHMGEVSVEKILELDFQEIQEWMENPRMGYRTLWRMLTRLATSPKGRSKNKMKDPTAMVITIIGQLAFSRSHHANYLQQAFSLFFKADGSSSKANTLLNHLSITMSSTWQNELVDCGLLDAFTATALTPSCRNAVA
ncbi:hypothetical protein M407DRAFT_33255 [Tulasnella calospora MUT 4182]|uniref:Uncharacterized protein n=1 Tax=Tulasnella calospora MUT 4182 TaxID=1051891 RepID=A0A0C3K6S7_9AGAM|nr:hypothetical protein M407DRAFT_33255 [Tulasnella calospora MUT 4182]